MLALLMIGFLKSVFLSLHCDIGSDYLVCPFVCHEQKRFGGGYCYTIMGCAGGSSQVSACVGADYSCVGVKDGKHPVLESGGVYSPSCESKCTCKIKCI